MVVYLLQSINGGEFSFECKKNLIIFGHLNNQQTTITIYSNQFSIFFESIKKVLTEFEKDSLSKNLILTNYKQNQIYLWETCKLYDVFSKKHDIKIKLSIEDNNSKPILELILNELQFTHLIKCFQFSYFTVFPLNAIQKLWLKHCSSVDFKHLKDNCLDLFKEAQAFKQKMDFNCDEFDLTQLFMFHFSDIEENYLLSLLIKYLQDKN